MNQISAFSLAVATLLAVPGPTNTLLAVAGATLGVRGSLKLIAAEILGYLVAIGFLLAFAGPVVNAYVWAPIATKLLASAYLGWTALHLWRVSGAQIVDVPAPATLGRLFLTTLLNPKTLIFAFVVFPAADLTSFGRYAATFSMLAAVTGVGWIVMGNLLARLAAAAATPKRISRFAAVSLALFATIIAGSAIAAMR